MPWGGVEAKRVEEEGCGENGGWGEGVKDGEGERGIEAGGWEKGEGARRMKGREQGVKGGGWGTGGEWEGEVGSFCSVCSVAL